MLIDPYIVADGFLTLAADGHGGGEAQAGLPPLHPILVHFTVALIPASFGADLLGAWCNKPGLRATGWWTLLLGAILTPFTALFGWLWMTSGDHGGHWQMQYHQWLGISLAVAIVALALWRGWLARRERGPGWGYGIVAAALLAAVMIQGDLGGSMTYGQGLVFGSGDHSGHEHGGGGEAGGDAHGHADEHGGVSPAGAGGEGGHHDGDDSGHHTERGTGARAEDHDHGSHSSESETADHHQGAASGGDITDPAITTPQPQPDATAPARDDGHSGHSH